MQGEQNQPIQPTFTSGYRQAGIGFSFYANLVVAGLLVPCTFVTERWRTQKPCCLTRDYPMVAITAQRMQCDICNCGQERES